MPGHERKGKVRERRLLDPENSTSPTCSRDIKGLSEQEVKLNLPKRSC